MNTNDIENAINHIISLQEKLCYCENNLQYIKRLQALKYWLHKFESLGLVSIDKFDVYGQYGKFNRCSYRLDTKFSDLAGNIFIL